MVFTPVPDGASIRVGFGQLDNHHVQVRVRLIGAVFSQKSWTDISSGRDQASLYDLGRVVHWERQSIILCGTDRLRTVDIGDSGDLADGLSRIEGGFVVSAPETESPSGPLSVEQSSTVSRNTLVNRVVASCS